MLNNKLARTIRAWQDGSLREGDRFNRTLKDLEVTKLRALDGFPETFGLPYSKTFVELSCVDQDLDVAGVLSRGIPLLPVGGGLRSGQREGILHRLEHAKGCKDTLEVMLAGSGTTPPPTTTSAPKPAGHAYRGPIDGGTYLASGSGSHLKLTVTGRNVQIFYGTSFRWLCAGPATRSSGGRSPDYHTFVFHPGGALHPISAAGAFTFKVLRSELDGRFVGRSTVRGVFHLNSGAKSECRGDHRWTATLNGRAPAAIQPIPLPVLFRTRGYWWVQQALLPSGFARDATDEDAAFDSRTGQNAAWSVTKGAWFDTQTGKALSQAVGPDTGWLEPTRPYRLMQRAALPRGFTLNGSDRNRAHNATSGVNAVWNDAKQEWLAVGSGRSLTLSGLSVPAPPSTTHRNEEWQVSGASRSHQDPFDLCVYVKGPAGQSGTVSTKAGSRDFESQVPPQQKSFRLDASGVAEVVFTEPPVANDGPDLIAFTIARNEPDGSVSKSGTQWGDAYQPPPWGLPACTSP